MPTLQPGGQPSALELAYQGSLSEHLPEGEAWARSPESVLQRLLLGIAGEFARAHGRLDDFSREIDPRTTIELLPAWEEFLGLPEECAGPAQGIQERRAAVVAKLLATGAVTPAAFVALAARLGYTVRIKEHGPFRMGLGRMGDSLDGPGTPFRMGTGRMGDRFGPLNAWQFVFEVITSNFTERRFRMGSTMGTRLMTIGNDVLECAIRHATPAHLSPVFTYETRLQATPAVAYAVVPAPGLAFTTDEEEEMVNSLVLAQASGKWSAGTEESSTTTNPELLSPFYRTRIDISYSGTTGSLPAVNTTLTGTGWAGRLMVINHVGPGGTAQISLYSGTSAGTSGSPDTLTHGGGTLTGVDCGASVGRTTGYADTSGKKAPRRSSLSSGYFNCVGVQQDVQFGPTTHRFPLSPEYYDCTFEIPNEEFAEGSDLEIELTGVVFNSTTGGVAKLLVALNIGEPIFATTALDAANLPVRLHFLSPAFPVTDWVAPGTPAEEPISLRIRLSASRKDDRTEGNIAELVGRTNEGVLGMFCSMLQRGSDVLSNPSGNRGFRFERGDISSLKRSQRQIGVWIAVAPATAPTGEQFYVNIHTMIARLVRDEGKI